MKRRPGNHTSARQDSICKQKGCQPLMQKAVMYGTDDVVWLGMQVADFSGHNTSLFVLGVMILWFGWYGFNPGSELYIVNGTTSVANAAVTTTIAPATAGISALAVKTMSHRFVERQSGMFVPPAIP